MTYCYIDQGVRYKPNKKLEEYLIANGFELFSIFYVLSDTAWIVIYLEAKEAHVGVRFPSRIPPEKKYTVDSFIEFYEKYKKESLKQ